MSQARVRAVETAESTFRSADPGQGASSWRDDRRCTVYVCGIAILALVQAGESAPFGKQTGRGAGLHDAAVFQNDDAVGSADRRKAMCDDEGGPPLHQPLQGRQQVRLRLRV